MDEQLTADARYGASRGRLSGYVAGFGLSIVLTLVPYLMVRQHTHTRTLLIVAIVGFALCQLVVQLIFFLHLDRGSARRWNLAVLIFAATVVVIVVFGSLWIMNSLNTRLTPAQMQQYVNSQNGF